MTNKTVFVSDAYNKIATVTLPVGSFAAGALYSRNSTYSTPKILTPGSSPSSFKDKAEAAEKVYDRCPLVQQTLNMFVDLIFHTITIRHKDKETERILKKVFHLSNIEDAIEAILLDYFIYGNSFPYRYRGDSELDPYEEDFNDFEPFMWINLNPKEVEIEGDTITEKEYVLKSSSEGDNSYSVSDEVLDKELLYHIAFKKAVRDKKASPPLASLARAVDLYIAYLDGAMATIENPIPAFVHVRVGHPGGSNSVVGLAKLGVKKGTIEATVEAMQDIKTKSYLVTSDAVEANSVSPGMNSQSEQTQTIYSNIIQQIEEGLGISRAMVTSNVQGGGSLQWFNITKLVKTLESARRKIHKWIDREMKYIVRDLDEEGLLTIGDAPPIVMLDELSLRDEDKIKGILLKMYEKGIVSANTTVEECDLDFQVELNRKALEKEGTFEFDGSEYPISEILVPPTQPFQGKQTPEDGGDDGDKGGRPTGTDSPNENTREAV